MSSLGIELNNNGWTTDSGLPSDPPSVSTIPLSEPELNDEAWAFSVWIQQHVADAIEAATMPLWIEVDCKGNSGEGSYQTRWQEGIQSIRLILI